MLHQGIIIVLMLFGIKNFISKIQGYRYCHQSKSKIHFFDRKTIWTPKLLETFYVSLFWCVCRGECSVAYHTMYIISWKTYTWYCKLMLNILVTILFENPHIHISRLPAFTDSAIVLSMLMPSFIFAIVCGWEVHFEQNI